MKVKVFCIFMSVRLCVYNYYIFNLNCDNYFEILKHINFKISHLAIDSTESL